MQGDSLSQHIGDNATWLLTEGTFCQSLQALQAFLLYRLRQILEMFDDLGPAINVLTSVLDEEASRGEELLPESGIWDPVGPSQRPVAP